MCNQAILTEKTFVLDKAFTLTIGQLKEWGYLGEQPKSGKIIWSKGEKDLKSIRIHVDVRFINPYIELFYKIDNDWVHYKIELITIPSNLGTGKYWYFICPVSGKRARKLYFKEGKFVHRNAYNGNLYKSQILSHKDRKLKKIMDGASAEEKIDEKHFTPFYKGLPTAKYKSMMKKVKKAEGLDFDLT